MATTGARDTSTFDICEPWYGDKGGPFTRTFSPAFLSGMRGKSEEYVTYYDHLQGDSPGLGSSKKTEHFRRWQLIMRYMVTHGCTYVHLCKTADMLADPMAGTPKDYIQFLNFRRYVTGMS